MTVIQIPGAECLTSMVPDTIIETAVDIIFEVKQGGTVILSERYSPDAGNSVSIKDLGRVFESYLGGTMAAGIQASLSKSFTIHVDSTLIATTTAIFCRAYTAQPASAFIADKKPLHMQYASKVTVPLAKEYLTFNFDANQYLKSSIVYRTENSIIESDPVNFVSAPSAGFRTFEITLSAIAALFPLVDPRTIMAYKVGVGEIYTQFQVDWTPYVDTKIFRYLNSFSVPTTFVCRGEVERKRSHTFESSKVNRQEIRFGISRADTFKISVGRKFSRTDELLIAEMTQAEQVQVFFRGEYRDIIITEEDSNELQRRGSLSSSSFTFRFADERLNTMIQDPVWILETGTWNDWGIWYDDGLWND